MLLIKTEVKLTDTKGLGLFTLEDIKKDQLIWKKSLVLDIAIDENKMLYYTEAERQYIFKYGFLEEEYGEWIVCTDDAKYMNHDDSPNCYDTEEGTFAAKDITKGEELTCDYFTICDDVKKNGLNFKKS